MTSPGGHWLAPRSRAGLFVGTVDALADGSVRLVLGNLTSEAIIQTLPEIRRVLAPDGVGVFSGVLASQAAVVAESLREGGFHVVEQVECGEWVSYRVAGDGD